MESQYGGTVVARCGYLADGSRRVRKFCFLREWGREKFDLLANRQVKPLAQWVDLLGQHLIVGRVGVIRKL